MTDALFSQATRSFAAFTLVVLRLAGLSFLAPVFSHRSVPWRVRAVLAFALALVATPLVEVDHPLPDTVFEFAGLGIIELALGAALGMGVAIVLAAAQMSGALIDQQLGLPLDEHPEPDAGSAPLSRLLNLLGLAVFLAMGGHLLLVSALLDSFRAVPPGTAGSGVDLTGLLQDLVQQSLLLSVRMAAPVLAAMAAVGIASGILGRAVPQLPVLALAAPVRVLVGLAVLGLSLAGGAQWVMRSLPAAIETTAGSLSRL